MIRELLTFILPNTCALCQEVHDKATVLCDSCLPVMTFLPPLGKRVPHYQKVEALFEAHSPMIRLLSDGDRFREEIAALFFYQFLACNFPAPSSILAEKDLRFPLKSFKKLVQKGNCLNPESPHTLILAKKYPPEEVELNKDLRPFLLVYSLTDWL